MKLTTLFLAFATAVIVSDCAHGQLLKNLFGGGDTAQSEPLGLDASVLSQASNLLGQQKLQLPSLPSLLNQQSSGSNILGQGGLGDLSKLVPTPQLPSLSPPNFLNQFNAKSKEMVDRTTDWARTKQQQLKEKTLGRLVGGNALNFLKGSTPATDNQPAELAQPPVIPPQTPNYYANPGTAVPAQPQIRSAANPNGQPTVRF